MRDRILAVVVGALALGYLFYDWLLPKVTLGDPLGPQAFPALVGGLLLISAILLFFERRARPTRGDPAKSTHYKVLAAMLVWTMAYYAVFDVLGYIISTLIYIMAMLCYFNRGRYAANAGIATGFTAIAYTIFSGLLDVQLPSGPGFF